MKITEKQREEIYSLLEKEYNTFDTVLNNINNFKTKGIKISSKTIYAYLNSRGIEPVKTKTRTKRGKKQRFEFEKIYNSKLSVKENIQIFRDNNISINIRQLYRFCEENNLPTKGYLHDEKTVFAFIDFVGYQYYKTEDQNYIRICERLGIDLKNDKQFKDIFNNYLKTHKINIDEHKRDIKDINILILDFIDMVISIYVYQSNLNEWEQITLFNILSPLSKKFIRAKNKKQYKNLSFSECDIKELYETIKLVNYMVEDNDMVSDITDDFINIMNEISLIIHIDIEDYILFGDELPSDDMLELYRNKYDKTWKEWLYNNIERMFKSAKVFINTNIDLSKMDYTQRTEFIRYSPNNNSIHSGVEKRENIIQFINQYIEEVKYKSNEQEDDYIMNKIEGHKQIELTCECLDALNKIKNKIIPDIDVAYKTASATASTNKTEDYECYKWMISLLNTLLRYIKRGFDNNIWDKDYMKIHKCAVENGVILLTEFNNLDQFSDLDYLF